MPLAPRHDRALLLHGGKRNQILTLDEVRQYGIDEFGNPDHVRIYGMAPAQWYARGIRLLGRTAVECTRDALADRIGRDVAAAAVRLAWGPAIVVDPFAGSCNTLYWILRHLPGSEGIACELDPQVHALTRRNLAAAGGPRIELLQGDSGDLLARRPFPSAPSLVVFVAPPWGAALDEAAGLDLRRTTPPVAGILRQCASRFADRPVLFAVQVYERVEAESLAGIEALFGWCDLHVYDLEVKGKNHGLLLGTIARSPQAPLTSRRAARGKG